MEQELLNIAIENLSINTGMMIETAHSVESSANFDDGELKFFRQGLSFNMPFTVKRKITLGQLPFIREYVSKGTIVIFEYAPKSIKEELRRLDVNYLEISGNAYIANDSAYIFIDTNKRIKLEDTNSNAAFSKTGLKVIYQLLSDKEAINYSYRELRQVSGVSIDTIGRVYKELVRDKYLVKINNRKYKIIDYDRLFKDWVTLFNKTLRPKLKKRSFRFGNNQSNLQDLLEANFDGKISGELAAEHLSRYNIAEKAIIYTAGSFVDLAMKLGLRPDQKGQITIIEKFWNDKEDDTGQIADLPLIYADLVADPKPRNLETAKLIFNENIYETS